MSPRCAPSASHAGAPLSNVWFRKPLPHPVRFLLLLVLLALMPLQSWAGTVSPALGAQAHAAADVHAADATATGRCVASGHATAHAQVDLAGLTDRWQAPGDDAPPSWPADPASAALDFQPGADLAEQLIPSTPLRFAAVPAIAGPPRYAPEAVPEPHLPRLPRPPRG